jgi:hypothetical protein
VGTLAGRETAPVVPAVWMDNRAEGEEAETEGMRIFQAESDGLERNAAIAGAIQTPIQEYLKSPTPAEGPVFQPMFPSPLELFDAGGKVTDNPRWQGVIDELSRWSSAAASPRFATQVELAAPSMGGDAAGEALVVDGFDHGPPLAALSAQVSPAADTSAAAPSDDGMNSPTSWRLGLTRFGALALSLTATFLGQERLEPRRKQELPLPERMARS